MSIFDFFKRKTEIDDKTREILEKHIENFFPKDGCWYSPCFSKSKELSHMFLPCHLRDNKWMSKLFHQDLEREYISIPRKDIEIFMNTSQNFKELRHDYELAIVHWQINFIMNGGEYWLIPEGYDEGDLYCSEEVEEVVRGGVVRTLTAIGMDPEVIEEGLEGYSKYWLPTCLRKSFYNIYEPINYLRGTPEPADEQHRKNWTAEHEYLYYRRHKNSVYKYGTVTPNMAMTYEEYCKIKEELVAQNKQRANYISLWEKGLAPKYSGNKSTPSVPQENTSSAQKNTDNKAGSEPTDE